MLTLKTQVNKTFYQIKIIISFLKFCKHEFYNFININDCFITLGRDISEGIKSLKILHLN